MPDIAVARVDSVPAEGGRAVRVAGLDLAVFCWQGEVHVFENRCAHLDSPLVGGFLHGCFLTCPSHGWTYELATGRRVTAEDAPPIGVRRYEAWVEGGDIIVRIDG